MGTTLRLGAGAFPMLLCALLFLLGLAIATIALFKDLKSQRRGHSGYVENWSWRGVILISLPPMLFGLFIRDIGLIVSLFVITLLCTFASRDARLRSSLLLSAILTLFCVGVFVYGLGLPIPLWGRWLGGH
jgi:putative tricarboxylic transport membrane protein